MKPVDVTARQSQCAAVLLPSGCLLKTTTTHNTKTGSSNVYPLINRAER